MPADINRFAIRSLVTTERRGLIALALFTLLLAVYLANGRTLGSGDTLPARYPPFAILQRGTFHLDGMPGTEAPYFYAVRRTPHGIISDLPVMAAVLASPLYVSVVLVALISTARGLLGWTNSRER